MPEPSYVALRVEDSRSFFDYAYRLNYEQGDTMAVRLLRGAKMQTLAALYNEFSAALQFPEYFGENWDALEECLTDLEWLSANSYTLFISNFEEVLRTESEKQFTIFLNILSSCSQDWNRRGTPFHVVLHCAEPDLDRLRARASDFISNLTIQNDKKSL